MKPPTALSPELKHEAEKLVARSRAGDQNATGMLDVMGQNARAGHPQAQASHAYVLDFIARHPAPSGDVTPEAAEALIALSEPGVTPEGAASALEIVRAARDPVLSRTAAHFLSQGRAWTPERIAQVHRLVSPECHDAFEKGLLDGPGAEAHPPADSARHLGACLGMARRIQATLGGGRLAFLCPDLGWELD